MRMRMRKYDATSIWRMVETSSPPILSLSKLPVDSLNKISTSFTLRSFTYIMRMMIAAMMMMRNMMMIGPQEPPAVDC